MKKLLITLVFLLPSLAWGATTLFVPSGGTGWGDLQGGSVLFGNWTGKIATSSAFSYATTTNTLSVQDLLVNGVCTGCGGSGVFDWTPTADGNSTSTRLIFGNGFISQASSSVSANLLVSGLLQASSTITVGSGTSTFAGNLALAGNLEIDRVQIISSSASSTAANGWDIDNGCFAIRGTCVGGGGGSSNWTDARA